MTLSITIQLTAEDERNLTAAQKRRDEVAMRQVLEKALAPVVQDLLDRPIKKLSIEEWLIQAEEMITDFTKSIPPGTPPLSEYALSREGIYEDHL